MTYDAYFDADVFRQTCREFDKKLGQEFYACEKDNKLIVFKV